MKKLLSVLLAVTLIASLLCAPVFAADEIKITINDEAKSFDVMPVIVEGRTLVPMRGIFEALGAEVGWDDATKTVTGKTSKVTVKLQIGSKLAVVGTDAKALDVPAQIVEGRTMVPVRFIAESLGCKVDWDGNTKTVIIVDENAPKKSSDGGSIVISADDFYANINLPNKDTAVMTKDDATKTVKLEVASVPEKAATARLFYKNLLDTTLIPDGDTLLIKFDARLISGGIDGKGYLKLSFQSKENTSKKPIFASVAFGSEWTTVYAPFVQNYGANHELGFRYGACVQTIEFKNFELINYGTAKKVTDFTSSIVADPGAAAPTTPAAPSTPATPAEPAPAPSQTVSDASLPAGGTVVIGNEGISKFSMKADFGTGSVKDGVVTADITTKPEKDSNITLNITGSVKDKFNKGDIGIMVFKARLVSGGENGMGYIKPQIQMKASPYTKSLFARTTFGSEWTTCYLPFVAAEGAETVGMRLGGMVQKIEIKDFQLINYGTSVKLESLPSTILAETK